MSEEHKPETPPEEPSQPDPPDGRGPRPTDPNELAKWIVGETTEPTDAHEPDNDG